MRAVLKWLLIGLGAVAGIALAGIGVIYVLIGFELDSTFENTGASIDVPEDRATVAEGERLARLRGCMGGCHGETVNGGVFFDVPDGTRIVAPDLGRIAQTYSIPELENGIRHGIRPDGTSVILAMPSAMFYHLSDQDLSAIIAFLRSQAPGEEHLPESRVGPIGRLFFFYFRHRFGTILAAEKIDHDAPTLRPSIDEPVAHGRYLAQTICSECHGQDLRGGLDGFAPGLAVAIAYSPDDFRSLMRTGTPIGDRELGLMAQVAQARFSYFSDLEIDNLHQYLRTLATTANDD